MESVCHERTQAVSFIGLLMVSVLVLPFIHSDVSFHSPSLGKPWAQGQYRVFFRSTFQYGVSEGLFTFNT